MRARRMAPTKYSTPSLLAVGCTARNKLSVTGCSIRETRMSRDMSVSLRSISMLTAAFTLKGRLDIQTRLVAGAWCARMNCQALRGVLKLKIHVGPRYGECGHAATNSGVAAPACLPSPSSPQTTMVRTSDMPALAPSTNNNSYLRLEAKET